jgi:hypothetical protein
LRLFCGFSARQCEVRDAGLAQKAGAFVASLGRLVPVSSVPWCFGLPYYSISCDDEVIDRVVRAYLRDKFLEGFNNTTTAFPCSQVEMVFVVPEFYCYMSCIDLAMFSVAFHGKVGKFF